MVAHGVGLHAVVHETLGAKEFKEFIKGDVYYDPEVSDLYQNLISLDQESSYKWVFGYFSACIPSCAQVLGQLKPLNFHCIT